ncbi:alpha/beta fold hydrolase [Streptomyces durbertensis]|uniref:Alpha/beta fold hydrolase n=1 Tax=Streptomyces durbertensis TaxID=2448886 RepID=A0ABR6EM82_9ACTN|nr:alpha/beta hydrolase [Streptomyces durbertensis]MBB1246440.1 alpha/beta fold hydrolase [Streptomyces durbertensis]
MGNKGLVRAAAALLTAALLLTGCTDGNGGKAAPPLEPQDYGKRQPGTTELLQPLPTAVPDELRPYYGQKLRWRDCGTKGFECATLRVPLDYAAPDADEDVRLAVVRTRATGSQEPIGSLMVNPGGPGSSAVEYVRLAAGVGFPAEIRARYDIVGMDPRGVAGSQPVECLDGPAMDRHTQLDITPDDAAEAKALTAANKRFADGCRRQAGKLLDHVSTTEAARDMDVLREVLGDRKLHYVGFSYGTQLGATYAGLFPSRAGRLVLDGAMDPSLSAEQLNRDQTAGFNTAFNAFAADCVRRSGCPLGTTSAKDAAERLADFFERVDREPLDTGEDRPLTEALATTGVIFAMYDENAWGMLRDALTDAMKGDGAALLRLADAYNERDPDGSYGNIMFAYTAVTCLDQPAAFADPAEARKAVPSFEKVSPVFGRGFAYAALMCADWPAKPTGRPHRIEAAGADPILVIGTTRDPATPYIWAESLAEQLRSATLLTYDGDGHTAYVRGGDCVNDAVNAYLLEGRVPPADKRCP